MSFEPTAEQKAERILSEFPDNCSPSNLQVVMAVAAALREAQGDKYDAIIKSAAWEIEQRDDEIAALKAERDAAYIAGLERAIELAQPYEIKRPASNHYRCDFILGLVFDRIKAEIGKAEA